MTEDWLPAGRSRVRRPQGDVGIFLAAACTIALLAGAVYFGVTKLRLVRDESQVVHLKHPTAKYLKLLLDEETMHKAVEASLDKDVASGLQIAVRGRTVNVDNGTQAEVIGEVVYRGVTMKRVRIEGQDQFNGIGFVFADWIDSKP